MYLESVEISKLNPIAKVEIDVKSSKGTRKATKILTKGANLYEISGGLEQYKGYIISEIDAQNQEYDRILFTNGEELRAGQVRGNSKENYMARIQIKV